MKPTLLIITLFSVFARGNNILESFCNEKNKDTWKAVVHEHCQMAYLTQYLVSKCIEEGDIGVGPFGGVLSYFKVSKEDYQIAKRYKDECIE
jgi:hypothetical protein